MSLTGRPGATIRNDPHPLAWSSSKKASWSVSSAMSVVAGETLDVARW